VSQVRFTVAGLVTDPQNLPLVGARISLAGPHRIVLEEVRSGGDGRFRFSEVSRGRFELRVDAAGFSSFRKALQVPEDAPEELRISLVLAPVENQVTVTGGHGAPEDTFADPGTIRSRPAAALRERDAARLPRMLAEEPGILTQETTPGQGSPVLRGQGAQGVLYLFDGIRFNNSIYRSGNTQYLGWIPAAAVDGVEIFLGPAGTQHGSDALGGAIQVMSPPLPPWGDRGVKWGAETRTFFSSANLGAGAELNAYAVGRRAVLRLTGSYQRHQELRTGGGEDSHNVLTRFLGFTPGQARSTLGERLRDTDYAQSGWHGKLGLRLREYDLLTVAWLQSEQYGVRRYDRLLGGDGWLTGELEPQRLSFGYLRYQKLGTSWVRSLEATLSVNRQTDGQRSQVRETAPLTQEVNRATAAGYLVSASLAPVRRHQITTGLELYDEFIFGRRTDTAIGAPPQQVRARFPNGSRYRSLAGYLVDDWEVVPNKLLVDGGLRFSSFRFRGRAGDDPLAGGLPSVPDANETFRDLTFHAGASRIVRPELIVFGRVARGFRAPSTFDLGELGLTGGGFEVSPREAVALGALIGDSAGRGAASTGRAWTSLRPEALWSFEAGWRWRARRLSGDVTGFRSEATSAIQRRTLLVPGRVAGGSIGNQLITSQDGAGRIFVALDGRPVTSRANVGRVRIQGVEATTRIEWSPQWNSAIKGAFHRGFERDTGYFARRIAPDSGFASLRWSHPRGRLWLEAFTDLSGPQTRLNPAEIDDPRIGAFRTPATITGFFESGGRRLGLVEGGRLVTTGEDAGGVVRRVLGPATSGAALFTRSRGFATLNFRGGFTVSERDQISFAVTNVTDANYRRHGSGFDAPGVDAVISYKRTFR